MQTKAPQPLLWFLAFVILIVLAGPFPQATTMLVVILIVLVLLKNWPQYATFFNAPQAQS